LLKHVVWLWSVSSLICGGRGLVSAVRRLRFMASCLTVRRGLLPLLEAPKLSPIGRLLAKRPETVGAVLWPYQCAGWDTETRLRQICQHGAEVERLGGPIDFDVDGQISLVSLGDVREGLYVVVDQAIWFLREGQLVINLFSEDVRIFSLAFSLGRHEGELTAFVGAVQGRDLEGIADEYRELTKAAHGMRPRDLLFELFRFLCAILSVERILAVADEHRHHRGDYFGGHGKVFSKDYNEMWLDRGGRRVSPMFFALPVSMPRREFDGISSKKRAMYRRRYELLDSIEQRMRTNYQALTAERSFEER
jgi:uncharacterized protein VirK/YbjX